MKRVKEIEALIEFACYEEKSESGKQTFLLKEISDSLAIIADKLDDNMNKVIDINNGILFNTNPYN